MKRGLKHRGRFIVMKCVEMSHAAAGGEYEIGLSDRVDLDLDGITVNLAGSGYELEERKPNSESLRRDTTVVTVLRTGRMLIQDLLPDTHEEALRIGEEVINAEEKT
jgi:hypothetical protein